MDILAILQTIVTYIYLPVAVIMILIILLQSGKGGLGTALGGGASQSVFGGGGASEFMAKVTQALAFGFMICCVFLAYASAHSGSSRLKSKSDALNQIEQGADGTSEINYERVGPNPLPLPQSGAAPTVIPDLPSTEPETPPVEDSPEAATAGEGDEAAPEAPVDGAPTEATPTEASDGAPAAEGAPSGAVVDGEADSKTPTPADGSAP